MNLEEKPFVFRINENGSGPNLLIQVCMERGWREYSESTPIKDGWNLWWKTSAFSVSQHKHLKAWQFTNHIPKGVSICRKDNLARNLKCMKKVYGAVYDISPLGYNLPLEYTKLVADCSRRDEDEDDSQKVWICKPVGQSQGRGIFLFKSLSDLCYDSNAVVQKYIKNPLLIGGYKFDLRLYVCVPSYHPLTIYLYKEGLVRFSTDKFSLSDLNNPFCHLTNSSLNKLGPGYAEQKDRIGAGCKWNFKQLRQYFQQSGIRDWLLWQKISALVTLTILSQSTSVPQTTNCFEFYGFDVLIDDKLKPWLLEVNLSPALGNYCDIDPVVKKPLLHDLFDLLGFPVCNTGLSMFTVLPVKGQSQWYSSSNSENEDGNDSENRQVNIIKTKQKSVPAVSYRLMGNRVGSGVKSAASSAIIVATAATKWRRKRRSSYLFGPPVRNSIDYDKLKPDKQFLKNVTTSVNLISDSLKIKDSLKLEEKKCSEKINEAGLGKKSVPSEKRNREKSSVDKIKTSNSATEIQKREKIKLDCHPPSKAIFCMDNSKSLRKIENAENKIKKKKKIEVTVGDIKHGNSRIESRSIYAYERPKKIYPSQTETNLKAIVFPINKSYANKGFRGRTKPLPPILWGNGKNWRTPAHREGDWSRIYPFNNFNSKYAPTFEEDYLGNKLSVGDKQIRLVVHHVTNFIKVSKQIFYKGIHSTEEELNSQLINHLGMTGDVWLPKTCNNQKSTTHFENLILFVPWKELINLKQFFTLVKFIKHLLLTTE